jgi:hypothetical protein
VIYAVEILDGKFVKVGFSADDDVNVRIAALQTGSPFQIRPLFTTWGTLSQEKSLHASLRVAFGRIRVPMPPNEWYPGRPPFFVEFLSNLKSGPDMGLAFCEKYNPAIKQGSTQPGRENLAANIRWPTVQEWPRAKRTNRQ